MTTIEETEIRSHPVSQLYCKNCAQLEENKLCMLQGVPKKPDDRACSQIFMYWKGNEV